MPTSDLWNSLFIQVTTNADVGKQRRKAAIAKAVDKNSDCTWERQTGDTSSGGMLNWCSTG